VSGAAEFRLAATAGTARAGTLRVRGKDCPTPAFLPVGTYGAVKGVPPELLTRLGTRLLLANACHLHDRPGADVVARVGGLHRFMGWDGLILTDSGGFQVFSLLATSRLDEEGVTFRSPVDGRELRLGPHEAVDIQLALDSDIAMAFDHCPPLPSDAALLSQAVERTTRWAAAARARHAQRSERGQALFGIVQGGLDDALRARSAQQLVELGFDGYAIGGLSVGESGAELRAALPRFAPLLPPDRLRYLMGVGRPGDVLCAIAAGFDVFDCVLPTRNARHGMLFTRTGPLQLKNARWREESGPIEAGCDCPACSAWPLAALRHLFLVGDPLAILLASAHNLRFLHRLVDAARAAILAGRDPRALPEYAGVDAEPHPGL
jgi:queuine tRNA-ribosyltransferase